jgi:hypothetical protein
MRIRAAVLVAFARKNATSLKPNPATRLYQMTGRPQDEGCFATRQFQDLAFPWRGVLAAFQMRYTGLELIKAYWRGEAIHAPSINATGFG